jgi:hypothetical protein
MRARIFADGLIKIIDAKTVALAADNSRPEFGGADNQTVFDQEPSFAGDLLLRAPSIGRFCDGKTPPSDPNSKCL